LKAKLATLFIFSTFTFMVAQAQTEKSIWIDEMNYSSYTQLQTAGWSSELKIQKESALQPPG